MTTTSTTAAGPSTDGPTTDGPTTDGPTTDGLSIAEAAERTGLTATGTSGPLATVDATRDWRGGALFLGPRTVANQAPTAAFTTSCSERTCRLDASGSTDADGSLAGYTWDLGDGTTATGAQVTHEYASDGDRTVRLTVTDDEQATATTTRQVSVAATPPASPWTRPR